LKSKKRTFLAFTTAATVNGRTQFTFYVPGQVATKIDLKNDSKQVSYYRHKPLEIGPIV
jgi:hypothetical protein